LKSDLRDKFSWGQCIKTDYYNDKTFNLTGTLMVPLHGFSNSNAWNVTTQYGFSVPGALTASNSGFYSVDINLTLCTTGSTLKQFYVSAMKDDGFGPSQCNAMQSVNVSNTVTSSVAVSDIVYMDAGDVVCVGIQSFRANEQVKFYLGTLLIKRLTDI
jgi:hypothetical protein